MVRLNPQDSVTSFINEISFLTKYDVRCEDGLTCVGVGVGIFHTESGHLGLAFGGEDGEGDEGQ